MSSLAVRRALVFLSLFPAAAWGTTLCVNQGGTGGCFGLIGAAIAAAGPGDTVLIAPSPTPYLERLTVNNKAITLQGGGPGPDGTIIDGGAAGQVLRVIGPGRPVVTVRNLTLRNGLAGDGTPDHDGAGVHNEYAFLALLHVIVSGNHEVGGGRGGGIANFHGSLQLNGSVVSGNSTSSPADLSTNNAQAADGGQGGGIYDDSDSGGPTIIIRSSIAGNTTGNGANETGVGGTGGNGGAGGGMYEHGCAVSVFESLFSGNRTGIGGSGAAANGGSGSGAGLYVAGGASDCLSTPQVSIVSSTFSGNQTGLGQLGAQGGDGGGLFVDGSGVVGVGSSTFAYNQVDAASIGAATASLGALTVGNSLLAYNATASGPNSLHDCSGSITSLGYNLMMEPDCTITPTTGDLFFVRGNFLAPLGDNGGPTQTHALLVTTPANPAIDSADNSSCPAVDQRGERRPSGGTPLRCDIGAFEVQVGVAFHALVPCRVFDTRLATGVAAAAPSLAAHELRTLSVAGRCGIPADAIALAVNLTVTATQSAGSLVVYRDDLADAPPSTSNLSFVAGRTRANNGLVELARDHFSGLDVVNQSAGALDFIMDVSGYFQ